ncbi:MAG: hypothetical protein GC164_13810 [Phycisphaera sp.]|nr:hypothetical protein [Phycisphaera sp.]
MNQPQLDALLEELVGIRVRMRRGQATLEELQALGERTGQLLEESTGGVFEATMQNVDGLVRSMVHGMSAQRKLGHAMRWCVEHKAAA